MTGKEIRERIPARLHTLAEIALSNARRDLESTGRINPRALLRLPNGEVFPLILDDEMSRVLFSDGRRRGIFFATIRAIAETMHATAVVLVSDTYLGKTTPQFAELPEEEQQRILNLRLSTTEMGKQGYATVQESVMISIQSPADGAMFLYQPYERHGERIEWLAREVQCVRLDELDGRIKMYGEVTP